jgi:hypothetical protein
MLCDKMKAPSAFKHGLLGCGAGVVISILFLPLNFLLALVLLVFLLMRLFGRTISGRVNYLIAGGIGLATVAVAIALPVKQLDGRVGPFRYGRMSLDELCQKLGKDHRVLVSADRWTVTNLVDSFATESGMTRREVLEKLAREANCELHIGYCGTGATFLFGAHPSFTRLHAVTV